MIWNVDQTLDLRITIRFSDFLWGCCVEIPAPATRKALWTSKNVPRPWCFNDFDFQIAFARRRGANFVTSWAADPRHPPVVRSWLSQPAIPRNFGKTQHFAQFLPAKASCHTSLLYHICAIASLRWQIFSSNSRYSRKLDSSTSFDK